MRNLFNSFILKRIVNLSKMRQVQIYYLYRVDLSQFGENNIPFKCVFTLFKTGCRIMVFVKNNTIPKCINHLTVKNKSYHASVCILQPTPLYVFKWGLITNVITTTLPSPPPSLPSWPGACVIVSRSVFIYLVCGLCLFRYSYSIK